MCNEMDTNENMRMLRIDKPLLVLFGTGGAVRLKGFCRRGGGFGAPSGGLTGVEANRTTIKIENIE